MVEHHKPQALLSSYSPTLILEKILENVTDV